MKNRLKEESVIFISVVKWTALAAVTGIIVGASTYAFVTSLNKLSALSGKFDYYFLLMPLAFFLSAAIVKYVVPSAEGHGASKVIESIHKNTAIKPIMVPVEFLRTIITLTFGGSAGKEGPSAQIGAGMASMFAGLLRLEGADKRKLIICGISGGFASVFGTPLAGAIFGIEVLFAGAIMYDVLLPSFVAGIISYQVSTWLGLTYFYHPVTFVPVFSEMFFIKVVIAGVFFGLASFALVEILNLGKKLSSALKFSLPVKAFIGGAILIVLTLIFSKDYLGLGLDVMQSALEGAEVPWYAFLMKSVFTSITLSFGGHGGIGTPIFFVGATAGSAFSSVIGVDPSMLAAIGFVALLAGAANTPIAASIMAVELFGAQVAPYAAIASVISFVVSGHRSAYPAQVLAVKKSSSLEVPLGADLSDMKPAYRHRDKSLIGAILGLIGRPK